MGKPVGALRIISHTKIRRDEKEETEHTGTKEGERVDLLGTVKKGFMEEVILSSRVGRRCREASLGSLGSSKYGSHGPVDSK